MSDCSEIRRSLSAHLDGEPTSIDRARLEAHIARCPACRGLEDEFGTVNHLMGPACPLGPSPADTERFLERLHQRLAPRPRALGTPPAIRKWALGLGWTLTATALALAVVFWPARSPAPGPSPRLARVVPAPSRQARPLPARTSAPSAAVLLEIQMADLEKQIQKARQEVGFFVAEARRDSMKSSRELATRRFPSWR